MMRMARSVLVAATLALMGCSGARMVVSSPGGADEARGGVIEFRSRGTGADGRREDAELQMRQYCQPASYLVIRENVSMERVPVGDTNEMLVTWTRIHFECD